MRLIVEAFCHGSSLNIVIPSGSMTLNGRAKGVKWNDIIQILLVRSSLRLPLQQEQSWLLSLGCRKGDFVGHNATWSNHELKSVLEALKTLQTRFRTVRPHKKFAKILLQHDNARSRTSLKTQEAITKLGWTVLPHSPYSLDLAPSDLHLFGAITRRHPREKTWE
jgi:hypothetical protein